ncbi:MAG: hypothetical protein WCK86_01930 [Planctomycetia bacterium]
MSKCVTWTSLIAGMLIGAGACLQDHAQADLLAVSWGGDYVGPPPYHPLQGHTGSFPPVGDDKYGDPDKNPSIDPLYQGRLVNDGTHFNPIANGYDESKTSAIFYGGAVVQWAPRPAEGNGYEVNTGFTNLSIENQGPNLGDAIQIEVKNATEFVNYAALFYWKNDNFLPPLEDAVVNLADVSFFIKTTQGATTSPVEDYIRWVVKKGENEFYISEGKNIVENNTVLGFGSGDLALLNWYAYNPIGSLSQIFARTSDGGGLGASTVFANLTNITALGFQLEWGNQDNPDIANRLVDLKIKGFTANLGIVPEPGFAIVGLFGVGLFAVRRLRSRKSQSSPISMDQSLTP